jgi:hypothetical protein
MGGLPVNSDPRRFAVTCFDGSDHVMSWRKIDARPAPGTFDAVHTITVPIHRDNPVFESVAPRQTYKTVTPDRQIWRAAGAVMRMTRRAQIGSYGAPCCRRSAS